MNQPVEPKMALSQTQNLAVAMAGEALVMMVDDEEVVIDLIQAYLDSAGYRRFISTTDPRKALELMLRERPQVVLLDINMPGMSGLQIMQAMRADPSLQHVPVIVLTGVNDPETKLRALGLGASDFLGKPVDESELVLRLRNTLAAKAYQDYLAYYDRVTGLANRHRFMSELDRAVREAYAEGRMGAVLEFDLDRFKQINEALGPATGDHVIKEAGRRVRRAMHSFIRADEATLQQALGARFGGDEFSVLLPSVSNVEQASRVAEAVLRALADPYQVDAKELHLTASAGVALFPADGIAIDEVVRNAEAALRQAKQAGGNGYRFYSKEFNDKAALRLSIESQLRKAIERGELELFYQPKLRVETRTVCGAEALLRWRHPQRGIVPPSEFVSVAEESGLIAALGEWALHAACRQLVEWDAAGLKRVPISVNLSPRQFQPQLPAIVQQAIGVTGQAEYLRLEVTESSVMGDPHKAITLLRELKALGMKLSLDDFGTGYSSLSYLQKLPLDEIKIDRSFLSGISSEGGDAVLVDVIIAMAHGLGLTVVAEGVESEMQLEYLRKRGCDECQGFLFSQPLRAAEFAAGFLVRA
ncbi:MAG TPA: EAL domain-containing protein [Burkholderiales bacterium]|jgi:diguanylate cyclase (GGDEF)-like protein|nr:EAL domain-containing protein [Burkholderiales bacterium]